MERLLVTGASGLLGSAVCGLARNRYQVVGTYLSHPLAVAGVEMTRLDLSEPASVMMLESIKPRAVIHCAAMTDVERCQAHPEAAVRHNTTASRHVAQAAKAVGARLVHISTESVFDGLRGDYRESDAPAPLNTYARTKRDAEIEVLAILPSAAVVRTTLYGWDPVGKKSLAEWMLAKLEAGEEVPGFEDAVFSPIYAVHLADKLLRLAAIGASGILHAAGAEACSKYAFAQELAETFGFDRSRVRRAALADAVFIAKRPANVSLNVDRAERLLGAMPSLREGLHAFKEHRHVRV